MVCLRIRPRQFDGWACCVRGGFVCRTVDRGVTAVIIRGGEVLLGRRSDNHALTPITGIVDPGEEPADAAVGVVFGTLSVRVADILT